MLPVPALGALHVCKCLLCTGFGPECSRRESLPASGAYSLGKNSAFGVNSQRPARSSSEPPRCCCPEGREVVTRDTGSHIPNSRRLECAVIENLSRSPLALKFPPPCKVTTQTHSSMQMERGREKETERGERGKGGKE